MFRLEKLEISGFKSFADRTSLSFGEGITGVVGPNGCGKSNIAEAISWVLGEQSAKSLRGGKMEDVIFNGTRDRKPQGMAEVLLTLVAIADIAEREEDAPANDDGSDYDEVVEAADHAAKVARSLVEQVRQETSDQAQPDADAPEVNQPVENRAGEPADASASVKGGETEIAPLVVEPGAEQTGAAAIQEPASEDRQREDHYKAQERKMARRRKRRMVAISAGERITIGRRLYRTGDSDYLINGHTCLLRDIQDLFAGTGLGGAHYAIIEQGRIGQILSSKPLDRRALIEEAAGITKFKSRKRAAELKLDSAKQNLMRLNDIITEIERQVNSLKRQAQKARRYRRLKDEMRGLQKLVYTHDYYRLNEAIGRVAQDFEAAQARQAELDQMLLERETEYRAVSAQSRAAEDELTELREQASAVELEADRARNRRAFEEQQIKELTARIEELERDQRELSERLALLDAEAERRAADLKSFETEVSFEQAELLNREGEYQAEMSRLRQSEIEIEQLRQRLMTEIGATERLRNLGVSLEDALRRIDLKQSSLRAEMERALTRRDEAMSEYERVGGEAKTNRIRLAELTARIEERTGALAALGSQASELREQLKALQANRASAEHRLKSLEEVDAHRSYYSDAVQQVLSPEQSARINGLGTLADFVEVEPQYERLIESLFGRELQCVLVPTIDDALAGVEYIKGEELGRGAFLVVGLHGGEGDPSDFLIEAADDRREEAGDYWTPSDREPVAIDHQLPPADLSSNESVALNEAEPVRSNESYSRARFDQEAEMDAGRFQLDALRAIDLLRLRSEIKTVVERAFPDKCMAYVVPDIEAALQLSIENASRVYVTYEGEQVVNGRLIVTGAQAGQRGTSLLGLKREIKQLRTQTVVLGDEETSLTTELSQAEQQLNEIDSEAGSLDVELRQHERTIAARDSQLEGLARDLERAEQHVRVVEAELGQTDEERADIEGRIAQLSSELQVAEASREAVEQSVTAAQAGFVDMREKTEQLSEQLSSARASVAARVERLQSARSELRRVENEAEDLRGRINRNRLELYESHSRAEQLNASQNEGESVSQRFEAERADLAEKISVATDALTQSRSRTDELERLLAEMRQQSAAAHDRRGQIEVERARIEAEAEHLTRTCYAELAMSLEDCVTSVELAQAAANMASETAGQIEAAGAEAIEGEASQSAAEGATGHWSITTDLETARARFEELRVKIDEMGPVNMMALEELEESEGRFAFMSEQRRDILDSIKLTEEGLAEIKRRSRERFRHAFTHINQNFQHMFVELFGGGRGEMILIDEDDILESGIDLIAQPPGKRLQNVLLLSGGEKAMAAISLVLAIFQYRPSPFCILDEVDAPLDEMNVGRFSNKVVEMSNSTQFLVITHNKRTMEAARALYGVTMEEPGVSKLVSVKFD